MSNDITTTQPKNLQRVFQITPHFGEVNALLENGFHSAAEILKLDQAALFKRLCDEMAETVDKRRFLCALSILAIYSSSEQSATDSAQN